MKDVLEEVLNWSEVWAVLIPLLVLLLDQRRPGGLKPVVVYLWIALFINLAADVIVDFKSVLPGWLQSNNPLYNIHSLMRFTCFSYFFIMLPQASFTKARKILPYLSAAFVVINFGFFDNLFYTENLSGNLLAAEAYLLLVYCMFYYLAVLKEEEQLVTTRADFWVVTGLSIYVVINFFVFLFYVPMITQNAELANDMWNVHNVAYIFFCIFIAKAFYATDTA